MRSRSLRQSEKFKGEFSLRAVDGGFGERDPFAITPRIVVYTCGRYDLYSTTVTGGMLRNTKEKTWKLLEMAPFGGSLTRTTAAGERT